MNELLVVVLVLGVALALAVVIGRALGAKLRGKRTDARRSYAEQRDFSFAESDPSIFDKFEGYPFENGGSRTMFWADNVMRGRRGDRDVTIIDYAYKIQVDDQAQIDWFTVVITDLEVTVPEMTVRPANLKSTFAKRDVEISPEFDDAFKVTTADPEFARRLLQPTLAQASLRHPKLTWRLERHHLLAIEKGRANPTETDQLLDASATLVRAMPGDLWHLPAAPADDTL